MQFVTATAVTACLLTLLMLLLLTYCRPFVRSVLFLVVGADAAAAVAVQ